MILPYLFSFAATFGLNVIPFFAPATWTVLSFISLNYNLNFIYLSLIGVFAATGGRIVLAKLSRTIVRQKFLSQKTRDNIDSIKFALQKHSALTFAIFLFYAFSPIPTNQLFISYGLTDLPLRKLVVPFFIGRLVSYLGLTFIVTRSVRAIMPTDGINSYFGAYFIIVQLLTILVVYLFTKIEWRKLLNTK